MKDPKNARLTMTLSDWAGGLRYQDLPNAVVHQAKRLILDYCAATIAGSVSGPARLVQEYLSDSEAPGPSSVLGTELAFSPAGAALVNGTATHGLEIDDGYTPGSYHPGGPVLSAVLSAAQARQATAEQILLATVVGYELSCRLAGAGHPATWRRGFHNTAVVGVFGAAAGVSTLIGGDIPNALGVAGSHAGGLFEFLDSGAEVKRLHAGKAARDGLVSAELAARGLTGPTTVLEGGNGYLHAFAGDDYDEEHLVAQLGTEWRMLRTYVKPYPCCRHLHGPIDAILTLAAEEPLEPDAVDAVRVETFTAASKHGNRSVSGFMDAQLSIPYAVAVTMLHGAPGLEHFGDEHRADPRVRQLLEKVTVEEAEDCARGYPRLRPARVTVSAGGQERTVRVDTPFGEPDNPVDDPGLEAKLLRLAGPVVGEERCQQIIKELWSFDAPKRLFDLLGGASQRR